VIDAVAFTKAYHAALNAFDLDQVESFFAEDAIYKSPGLNGEINGRTEIMHAMRKYFSEFSDQSSQDESMQHVDDNRVLSRWHLMATSKISGNKIERSGTEIISFDNNGLIAFIEVQDER
jgi:ketosteroid isomerase-like protein